MHVHDDIDVRTRRCKSSARMHDACPSVVGDMGFEMTIVLRIPRARGLGVLCLLISLGFYPVLSAPLMKPLTRASVQQPWTDRRCQFGAFAISCVAIAVVRWAR